MRKKILIQGGGGFIGGHLVKRLMSEGHWVRTADLKSHEYGVRPSEERIGDLADYDFAKSITRLENEENFDEIYQLAADMGGAGYIFSGNFDADLMQNSSVVNLNLMRALTSVEDFDKRNKPKIFYSSSACIYPEEIQMEIDNPGLREMDAYPANPDSEYGWEKLFSERLFLAYARNYGFPVRIARFHNVYGPQGTWRGGREKSPAAICRKVALCPDNGEIEIWGDGKQTRSYLYIDDCVDAVLLLMKSSYSQPINIGSEEIVSINELVNIAAEIAGKSIRIRHVPGPLGVRGRNSNNDLIRKELGWDKKISLREGLSRTYRWIDEQIEMMSAGERAIEASGSRS